jgi:hypothetical protein
MRASGGCASGSIQKLGPAALAAGTAVALGSRRTGAGLFKAPADYDDLPDDGQRVADRQSLPRRLVAMAPVGPNMGAH